MNATGPDCLAQSLLHEVNTFLVVALGRIVIWEQLKKIGLIYVPVLQPKVGYFQGLLDTFLELIWFFLLYGPLNVGFCYSEGEGRGRFFEEFLVDRNISQRCTGIKLWRTGVVSQVFVDWLIVIVESILFRQRSGGEIQIINDLLVNLSTFLLLTTSESYLLNKFSWISIKTFKLWIQFDNKTLTDDSLFLENLLGFGKFAHIHLHSHQLQQWVQEKSRDKLRITNRLTILSFESESNFLPDLATVGVVPLH